MGYVTRRTALCVAARAIWRLGRSVYKEIKGKDVQIGDEFVFTYTVNVIPDNHRWFQCKVS